MNYENMVTRLRKAAGPAIDFPDTLYDEAADAIEELKQLAEVIPHKCKCCIGCEMEKKNGGCDSFVLSPERAKAYIEENLERNKTLRELLHERDTTIDSLNVSLETYRGLTEAMQHNQQARWIPVTERLPSPMRAVLVWTPYKHNIFMAYLQGNKWYVWGPDDICCHNWPEYHAITHWMNLPQDPEPPKEG